MINHNLTKRELEILDLISHGNSRKDIAKILVLDVTTVQTHITNIYDKLNLSGNQDYGRQIKAVLYYLKRIGELREDY